LNVSPAAIDPDANLFTECGLDSVGLFNLVVELEEAHDVSFRQEDYPTLLTVRSVADYLGDLIRARDGSAA
jgi:acyl carrier protein